MTDANKNQDSRAQTAASLGDAAQRPSIWQLALPSILGNLSYTIVGMVQTKFVGELGPQALAAVGAGQRARSGKGSLEHCHALKGQLLRSLVRC